MSRKYPDVTAGIDTVALCQIIGQALVSPNVKDSNLEPANLVDTTQRIAKELGNIATAINNLAEVFDNQSKEDNNGF